MNFLDLPSEIRQEIFKLTIQSPNVPVNPSQSQDGRHQLSRDAFEGGGIWLLQPQNPALGLLLVNRQIHEETKSVIDIIPNTYDLDIMFVKHHGLWTTWSLPKLPKTHYVDHVQVTVRIFDPTDDLDPRFQKSLSFRGGDGGPELAVWSFYHLLGNLIRRGPGYIGHGVKSECTAPYIIRAIDIDILKPTDGAAHKSIVCTDKEFEKRKPRVNKAWLHNDASMPPEERLAQYMISNMELCLCFGRYTGSYAMFVFENVTEIIGFRTNGKEFSMFDLRKRLEAHREAYLSSPDVSDNQKRIYQEWVAYVEDRRVRMEKGLEPNHDRPAGGWWRWSEHDMF
ncbi:hypothetical protein HG530_008046 [Fusarium avenaceum]|nr:hypothetical protein HG530_008046 [Fusarium avenaceum]